jgi:hypothetical protein
MESTAAQVWLQLAYNPNTVVEWLTLLRIREVLGSDLGPETGYPDCASPEKGSSPERVRT